MTLTIPDTLHYPGSFIAFSSTAIVIVSYVFFDHISFGYALYEQ